jgi:hypothetical protein
MKVVLEGGGRDTIGKNLECHQQLPLGANTYLTHAINGLLEERVCYCTSIEKIISNPPGHSEYPFENAIIELWKGAPGRFLNCIPCSGMISCDESLPLSWRCTITFTSLLATLL